MPAQSSLVVACSGSRDSGRIDDGCDDPDDADRDVDQEDPFPGVIGDDETADDWTKDCAKRCDRAPDAHRRATPFRREDDSDERERLRHHECAADPLQGAEYDQCVCATDAGDVTDPTGCGA